MLVPHTVFGKYLRVISVFASEGVEDDIVPVVKGSQCEYASWFQPREEMRAMETGYPLE